MSFLFAKIMVFVYLGRVFFSSEFFAKIISFLLCEVDGAPDKSEEFQKNNGASLPCLP